MQASCKIAILTSVALSALAPTLFAPTAYAQSAPAQASAEPADDALGQIIVTGTRRADRTIADSPVPIDIIGAGTLANQGAVELNRALNALVPSFNFPQPSITDGTDVIRPATLRGLAPDQTLVLVNGKRRHTTALLNINGSVGRGSAAVDLNLIPTAAIGRIEVLRDGAAAQYGSDAIAGVINIVLKNAREGGSVSASFSQYVTTVDGVREITGIQRDAAGNPIVVEPGNQIFATNLGEERKPRDGETLTLSANFGLPLGPEGFINLTAEYRDRNDTNRAGFDPRRQFPLINGASDPREFTFNRLTHRFGDAATTDYSFFLNAGLALNAFMEVYTFASYNKRDGESAGFFRRPNDARNRNFSVLNPALPVASQPFTPFFPEGFLPLIVTDLEDYSAAVGIKGEVAKWNYDISFSIGNNTFDFGVENSFNTSLGAASPTSFDAGGLNYQQFSLNADVQRTYEDVGFIQSLSVAAGVEFRQEDYRIRVGDLPSRTNGPFAARGAAGGSQVFSGFNTPISEDRRNISAYIDLDADITERFNIAVAGRFEDFSDFGSDVNGKVSARFEVVEGFALRGAVSTGFRAPSLQQQFFTSIATNNIGGVLVDAGTFAVNNPIAQALGSQPLDAETSVSFSGGFVFNAIPRFNLTVDYYNIKIKDRIVVTENLGASGASPASVNAQIGAFLAAQGINASAIRFFVNGLDSRTQGVDVVATYRLDLGGAGNLNLTAAYNYNKTELSNIISTLGPLAQFPGVVLFGRQEALRLEQGQPRSKIVLSADYSVEGLGVSLKTTRFGRVLAPGVPLPITPDVLGRDDVVLEGKFITDLEIRYTLFDRLTLAVGANNLFDVYPTGLPTGAAPAALGGGQFNVNNFFIPFSAFSPFGFNGRQLYARANFTF
jgi:iron complex outermembrane recepter protein